MRRADEVRRRSPEAIRFQYPAFITDKSGFVNIVFADLWLDEARQLVDSEDTNAGRVDADRVGRSEADLDPVVEIKRHAEGEDEDLDEDRAAAAVRTVAAILGAGWGPGS